LLFSVLLNYSRKKMICQHFFARNFKFFQNYF